jgi:hypothetical protein
MPSLCTTCALMKLIVSGKGSRFLLCTHSQVDPRFPKYPPQPVLQCPAYAVADKEKL